MTFEQLCQLEPRLEDLLREARSHKGGRSFCANAVWFGYGEYRHRSFKRRLQELVGWKRKDNPILSTREAYDLAFHTIYQALPDCGDCLCARRTELIPFTAC
jgi:hypothetical protein